MTPLVSSKSSSDYSFGIFKLFFYQKEFEDTKGVIRREA
jgi:hypothetical protein